MRISTLLCLLTIVAISACKTQRFKIQDSAASKFFIESPVFRQGFTGFMLYDLAEADTIFQHQAHHFYTPASNMKLFSFYAGLKMLGDSLPAVAYCERNDTLYFRPTADPTLLHPVFAHQPVLDLLRTSHNALVYVSRPMDDGRFGPGWSWDDYSYYYSAEKSAMPVYGNMFWVVKDSLSENLDLLPEAFRPNVVLKIDSTLDYYNYARNEYFNEFTLTLNGREKHFEETIPFKTHEETAVRLLEDTLRRPIAMRSSLAGCPWTMKRSQPIDTLMKHMLIPSDNFLAEQIMLMCSGLLSDTLNSRKAMRFVHEKYLPQLQNKLIWRDGSGLSRYNKVTPAGMVHLLEQLWWDVEEDRLFSLLPANGVRGTLRRSFPSDVPYIFAKTGSLSYVYCLSGYVKCRSGKTMAFSFMNNNYALPTSVVKAEMAKVLEAIRDQY